MKTVNEVFAKRLKSARVMASLSQDQLVKRINGKVSKNSISKYEKGLMLPNSEVLIELSRALGLKTDFFYRAFEVEIGSVEFRKRANLSAKEGRSIKEQVTDQLSRYLELEEILNIQSSFINPLEGVLISDKHDVELAVGILREKWKLGQGSISNVIDLLEHKAIKVIELQASSRFDGLSGWANKLYPIVVLNQSFTQERKRLTALHELAHLTLNFNVELSQAEIEKLCFHFAGAFLLPTEALKMEIGGHRNHITLYELRALKESYGISIAAIMARAYSMGIISESSYLRFNKWNSKNRKEDGLGAVRAKESPTRFTRLLHYAASEEYITLSKAANLANQKLASFRQGFQAVWGLLLVMQMF